MSAPQQPRRDGPFYITTDDYHQILNIRARTGAEPEEIIDWAVRAYLSIWTAEPGTTITYPTSHGSIGQVETQDPNALSREQAAYESHRRRIRLMSRWLWGFVALSAALTAWIVILYR